MAGTETGPDEEDAMHPDLSKAIIKDREQRLREQAAKARTAKKAK